MEKKWYVLHTFSGHEAKVKASIEDMRNNQDFGEKVGEVLMPTQEVVQLRKGKKVKQTRKFFSSYLIIEAEMDKDIQHALSNLSSVTNFIGTAAGKPIPLREAEVARILGQAEKGKDKEMSEIPFSEGDVVKIKEGPFKNFTGTVDEVSSEKGKVKVMVSVFGRSTPVELGFVQVAPVS